MRVKELITESESISELKVSPNVVKPSQNVPGAVKKPGLLQKVGQAVSDFKKGYQQGSNNQTTTAAPAADTTNAVPDNKQSTATAEPAAQTTPAKPNATEFAQKLQSMFDEFVKANGSIGAPAVKAALKNMWMQSGGIKAESKKLGKTNK